MFNIGVDVIEISRFRSIENLERAAEFFLLEEELEMARQAPDIYQHLASRFALKEAVIKAMPEAIFYHDFQIVKQGTAPKVKLLKEHLKEYQVAVSLAHTETSAIGFAMVNF